MHAESDNDNPPRNAMPPERRRPATSCMTLPDTRRLCVQAWRANRGRKTRFSVRPHMLREEMIQILRVSAERATGITALNGRPARHRSVKRAPVLLIPKMFAMKHQCAVWADRNGTTTTRDDAELHWEFTAAPCWSQTCCQEVHAPRESR